jgi:hypothetical protein
MSSKKGKKKNVMVAVTDRYEEKMLAQALIKLTLISVLYHKQLEMFPESDPYGITPCENPSAKHKLHFRIGTGTLEGESKAYYFNKSTAKELNDMIVFAIHQSFPGLPSEIIDEVNKISNFISPP